MFDNGVRLNVEMQEHQEPDMSQIPKMDLPRWLKSKLENENKKQNEEDITEDEPAVKI